MNTTVITEILEVPVPLSASEQLEKLKLQYPEYYRAWRSMHGNNSKDCICIEWRGTSGLMKFIEDTSTLINNPTSFPGVKLKRKLKSFPYSPGNVYWSVPKNCRKLVGIITSSVQEVSTVRIPTLDTLIAMSRKDQEDRFNTLMSAHFSGTILSATEIAEMDALGKLITGVEILPPPESKYEDV